MIGYDTAIVRLHGGGAPPKWTAGLGMLVNDNHVVTCAHVVNAALGREQREQKQPNESERLELDFPLVDGRPLRPAQVIWWRPPPPRGSGGEDIAVLELSENAPVNAHPAVLAPAVPGAGARLRVFGYPGSPIRETGVWVDLDSKGRVEGGLHQVESRTDQTVKAQPGYSGSPVWDHATGQAVGILHAAAFADEPERDAYILPAPAVAQALELVQENSTQGSVLTALSRLMAKLDEFQHGIPQTPGTSDSESVPTAPSIPQAPAGVRRWAMMGGVHGYWQLIPGEVGPEFRPVAFEGTLDISRLRMVNASLALSCDGQVIAQLSRGRLALAWVDRARPRLDRWHKSFGLPFDDQETRLLAVALDFGDEVICLFSTDRATYRAEVSPTTELVVTETLDTPTRCAAILAGATIAIDGDGQLRSGELDLGVHGIADITSLDAARSGGRAVYAVSGRDNLGSPIVAETCSTGRLAVLPGLVADEVVVVRQLSSKLTPDLVLIVNNGRLERIPMDDAQ